MRGARSGGVLVDVQRLLSALDAPLSTARGLKAGDGPTEDLPQLCVQGWQGIRPARLRLPSMPFFALVPYNARNQASRARPRRLHEPGTDSRAAEASRRHAARARPRLVSNNALSQLEAWQSPKEAPSCTRAARAAPSRGRRATARIGNQAATPSAARNCLQQQQEGAKPARPPTPPPRGQAVKDVFGRHGHALPRVRWKRSFRPRLLQPGRVRRVRQCQADDEWLRPRPTRV